MIFSILENSTNDTTLIVLFCKLLSVHVKAIDQYVTVDPKMLRSLAHACMHGLLSDRAYRLINQLYDFATYIIME